MNTDYVKTSNYVERYLNANFIYETTVNLIDHIMLKVSQRLIQTKLTAGNFISDITNHIPNLHLLLL